jgi:hypothetical protein
VSKILPQECLGEQRRSEPISLWIPELSEQAPFLYPGHSYALHLHVNGLPRPARPVIEWRIDWIISSEGVELGSLDEKVTTAVEQVGPRRLFVACFSLPLPREGEEEAFRMTVRPCGDRPSRLSILALARPLSGAAGPRPESPYCQFTVDLPLHPSHP